MKFNFHKIQASTIESLKLAEKSLLAKCYFILLLKSRITTQHIWFLTYCLKHQLTPNYIKLKTNNSSPSALKAQLAGQRIWILEDRKVLFRKRNILNIYLKFVHSELLYKSNKLEFDITDCKFREIINNKIHRKYLKQKTKLNKLKFKQTQIQNNNQIVCHNSNNTFYNNNNTNNVNIPFSNHIFFDRFINFTNIYFSKDEINLLEKGFKHNIQNKFTKHILDSLAIDLEIIINLQRTFSHDDKNLHKLNLSKILMNSFNKNRIFNHDIINIIKSIKNKAISNDIIFTRADKGTTVIAIHKNEYINKTLEFLNTGNYDKLKYNPTNKYQLEIKNTLSKCSIISNHMDIIPMNPQAPKLYSLIKLHKENNPIRPVVSFIAAPSTKLSHYLIGLIKHYCNFYPKYSLKNSLHLINNIKDLHIPHNCKLISFDVKNLFPSVPPNEVIQLIDNMLLEQKVDPIIKTDILSLLRKCTEQNYFEFNGDFYSSSNGLIMGNPLSPLLAEIFMDNLEKLIHFDPSINNVILFWFRYVDDIFSGFLGTERQLTQFTQKLNKLHPNIIFTHEIEQNNSIHFLDLTIEKINNKLDFSIFHKPTHTDLTIHNSSHHPLQHKLAAYHCYIHRLINIPMNPTNFTKELNIIKQIAFNNGYNPSMIDTLLNKKQYSHTLSLIYPKTVDNNKHFNTLTFNNKFTNDIHKYLKKLDLNIAFRTNNNLGKFIKNNKSKTDKDQKSGVYKLLCGSCDKIYIGQTGRNFNKRIKEHRSSYIYEKEDSHYATHLNEENHNFNDNFILLHNESKSYRLNLLESLEINKYKKTDKLLNDQKDLNSSPLLNLQNKK